MQRQEKNNPTTNIPLNEIFDARTYGTNPLEEIDLFHMETPGDDTFSLFQDDLDNHTPVPSGAFLAILQKHSQNTELPSGAYLAILQTPIEENTFLDLEFNGISSPSQLQLNAIPHQTIPGSPKTLLQLCEQQEKKQTLLDTHEFFTTQSRLNDDIVAQSTEILAQQRLQKKFQDLAMLVFLDAAQESLLDYYIVPESLESLLCDEISSWIDGVILNLHPFASILEEVNGIPPKVLYAFFAVLPKIVKRYRLPFQLYVPNPYRMKTETQNPPQPLKRPLNVRSTYEKPTEHKTINAQKTTQTIDKPNTKKTFPFKQLLAIFCGLVLLLATYKYSSTNAIGKEQHNGTPVQSNSFSSHLPIQSAFWSTQTPHILTIVLSTNAPRPRPAHIQNNTITPKLKKLREEALKLEFPTPYKECAKQIKRLYPATSAIHFAHKDQLWEYPFPQN